MKKHALTIFILLLTIIFTGCTFNNKIVTDKATESYTHNEQYPSFIIDNAEASKGDKDVIVYVSLKDNPGFLTMAMNIKYDSNAMDLKKVANGLNYSEYNFVGPKNLQSGCTVSWFSPEIPEKIIDDVILELHFDIKEKAKSGVYSVSVSRPKNGGVVDKNKEEIIFNNAIGEVKIK